MAMTFNKSLPSSGRGLHCARRLAWLRGQPALPGRGSSEAGYSDITPKTGGHPDLYNPLLNMLAVKRGLYVAAAIAGVSLVVSAAKALWVTSLPYRFEGYEYTGPTRLAILSITNLGSSSVEFTGRAELQFADGWHPSWGNFIVIRSTPTIAGKKSGKWVFEVPPHEAKWKVTCMVQKHTFMERVASRLSKLSWIRTYARTQRPHVLHRVYADRDPFPPLFGSTPRTTTFASDWVNE